MRDILFGVVAGLSLAMAGASVVDEPVKTILLLAAICIAHNLAGKQS